MSTTEVEEPFDVLAIARAWPAILFVGIATIVLGVVVLAWPEQTLVVMSVLLGIQFVLFGLFRLIGAFSEDATAPGLAGFVGVLMMISGVIVLRHPYETVAVLATILGVVWIVSGSIDVIDALANRRREGSRLLHGLGGLLSVGAGVIVVAWPTPTLSVIAWISGLYLIIFGLFVAVNAFMLRHAVDG
jgi:uncharacterized membrane protein HdeD (DUF308 family)